MGNASAGVMYVPVDNGRNAADLPVQADIREASSGGRAAVSMESLVRRGEHFASLACLSVRDPGAIMRLRQLTGRVQNAPDLDTLLAVVLDAALAQTSADFGTVQISEPGAGALRIAAQSGFSSEFLEYFAVVDDDGAACLASCPRCHRCGAAAGTSTLIGPLT